MRLGAGVSFALILTALGSGAARGQTVTDSTLSGIVTSASKTMAPNTSATVFTVPATGFFILTQACYTRPNRVTLSGSTVGQIPHSLSGARKCTVYRPGVAFPAGEVLTCTNTSITQTHSCTITGDVVTN